LVSFSDVLLELRINGISEPSFLLLLLSLSQLTTTATINSTFGKRLLERRMNGAAETDDLLFSCAICGTAEGDSSNLTSQTSLQTNATVRCGHQL